MRRRFGRTLPLWLLLAFARPAAALQPLESFVAAARQYHPDALEAKANLDQQNAQKDVAWGTVLPGLSARALYTRNQYQTIFDLSSLGPPFNQIPAATLVPYNQRDVFGTIRVTLIDAAGFQRVAAGKTAADAAGEQLAATELQVEGATARAYYLLVANLALVQASEKALEVSKENLRLSENRYRAGVAPVLDVDRARADVETQVQQLAAAQLQVALAARALESASGVTPEPGVVFPQDDLHAEAPLEGYEAAVGQLPAVAASAESRHAAEQQADAQRWTLLPTLTGTLTEHYTNASGFTGYNWTWQGALVLAWSLDLTTRANINAQDAAADAARAREKRVRLAARDAVHEQWETVAANIARSRSARAGQSAAGHAAEQARDRYQAGTATQLDLLQAQRDAFTADVARIQADAELINARAQLQLAAGRSLVHTAQGKP